MRTVAQKRCPVSFERRMLAAYAENPATMNGRAMIGHGDAASFAVERVTVCRTSPCTCRTVRLSKLTKLAVAIERRANNRLLCGEQINVTHMS
jgi:hypothetical protein